MAFLSTIFLGFLMLVAEIEAAHEYSTREDHEMVMEEEEVMGLFEVIGSLLEDSQWVQTHPQPCTDTPWPGIQCEVDSSSDQLRPIFHVTRIHIGPDVINPPCKSTAHLSESLFKLPYLKSLSIFNCFVSSPVTLPSSLFAELSSLETLSLQSNPSLTGHIPQSLESLSNLRVLSLSQNNLQGQIPRTISSLIYLQQLDLSHNNLSSRIPVEMGALRSLRILDLSWNKIKGSIPCTIGQLHLLQKVDLSYNKLTETIPPDMGELQRLVLLDLSHNFIEGPIPDAISGLEHLEYLVMDDNHINSGMPLFLGDLRNLKLLSLSECRLNGLIPESLSSLKNLTALALDNNNLTGSVPANLGSLPWLDQLNVSHNQLSGLLQLPNAFVERLGNRLDVKGNKGLCIVSNDKTLPLYLGVSPCLNTTPSKNDYSLSDEHPENSEQIKPSWEDGRSSSSSLYWIWPYHPILWLRTVVCILSCLF